MVCILYLAHHVCFLLVRNKYSSVKTNQINKNKFFKVYYDMHKNISLYKGGQYFIVAEGNLVSKILGSRHIFMSDLKGSLHKSFLEFINIISRDF